MFVSVGQKNLDLPFRNVRRLIEGHFIGPHFRGPQLALAIKYC